MAGKQTGLGDNFYINGVDLSGDVNSLGRVGGGPALLDLTGINQLGVQRAGGVREGGLEFVALFNADSGQSHLTLSPQPRTDVLGSYYHGQTLGAPAANLLGKQINYDVTRTDSGDLRAAVTLASNAYGVEWGTQVTAGKRTDGAAGNGTGVDLLASTAFGLQAYLHVFAFTGTSVTVKLQESSDNGVGDAYADVVGGGFTAATGVTFQRIATAAGLTVERYLRVVTTGTFSNAIFAVSVTKNTTAPTF